MRWGVSETENNLQTKICIILVALVYTSFRSGQTEVYQTSCPPRQEWSRPLTFVRRHIGETHWSYFISVSPLGRAKSYDTYFFALVFSVFEFSSQPREQSNPLVYLTTFVRPAFAGLSTIGVRYITAYIAHSVCTFYIFITIMESARILPRCFPE